MSLLRPTIFTLLLGCILQGIAVAQTATTGAATNVTDLTATVSGVVNPGNLEGGSMVKFGITSLSTEALPFPSNYAPAFTNTPITVHLTQLQPSTTYRYRVVCFRTGGIAYGEEQTFTTGPPATPPVILNFGVDAMTDGGRFWSSYNSGSSTTAVTFEYGLTNAYGSTAPEGIVSGLQPSTSYHYRCKAQNNEGTVYSADATFTTHAVPIVATLPATSVTDMTAIINGSFDTQDGSFNLQVEHGPTTAYGTTSYPRQVPAGPQSILHNLGGLMPSTTYHYRIKATCGTGTLFHGQDMTFTTAAASTPPVISAGVGSQALWNNRADVWIGQFMAGSSPATLSFEYGTTLAYGLTKVSPVVYPISSYQQSSGMVTLTGLQNSTTYYFRARISNAQGTVYSEGGSFTTRPGAVLTTNNATNITDLGATLNGTINNSGIPLVVSFQYGETTSYGTIVNFNGPLTNQTPTPVSVAVSNLIPGRLYHYRVIAWESGDTSNVFYGPDVTFTTAAPSTPPVMGVLSVNGVTHNSATVNCHVHSGSSDAEVRFEYGTTTDYGQAIHYNGSVPRATQGYPYAVISGLMPSTIYHVRCVATNGEGTTTSTHASFTTNSAPVVHSLPATAVTDMTAILNGTVNAGGTGQVNVVFEFGTTTNYGPTTWTAGPFQVSGSTTTPVSAAASGFLPLTTYHYRVRVAYTANPDITFYGEDQTFTTGPPNTPPSVGAISTGRVTATTARIQCGNVRAGSSAAAIVWEFGTTPALGSAVNQDPPSLPVATQTNITTFLFGLTPVTQYYYRCTVTNDQGSVSSSTGTFTTLTAPTVDTLAATGITDLTAVLNGHVDLNDYSVGNGRYHFEFGPTTSYGNQTASITRSTTDGGFTYSFTSTINGLLPSTTYHARMVMIDDANVAFPGPDVTFTTLPPATPPVVSSPFSLANPAPTATTLNCRVIAGSSTATLVCDYGTTTSYGTQVTSASSHAPSTNSLGAVVLTGLSPATTYHYRFTVTNSEGTQSTTDQVFTTPSLPTVSTLAASINNASSATLNGSYFNNGATYTASFDFGTTTSYGATISGSYGIIGINFPGLPRSHSMYVTTAPQTEYHFRLKLTDNYGNVYTGSDASFTTPTPMSHWRSQTFGSASDTGNAADMANPVGDGIPNLMKYALDLNPLQTCVLPAPELITQDSQQRLRFIFKRYHTRIDLTYEVQVADSPVGPWTTIASSVNGAVTSGSGFVSEATLAVPIGSSGGWSQVEVRDPIGTGSSANRFMRLLVRRQ